MGKTVKLFWLFGTRSLHSTTFLSLLSIYEKKSLTHMLSFSFTEGGLGALTGPGLASLLGSGGPPTSSSSSR